MIEEAIIYAFIICVFIFTLIDVLYRVSMRKDIGCIHEMMHDIHHMLFVGSNKEDIRIATEHYEHNHEEIKSWDES